MDYDKKLQKVQKTLDTILERLNEVAKYHKKLENVPENLSYIQDLLMDIRNGVDKPLMEEQHCIDLIMLSSNYDRESARKIFNDNDCDFGKILLSTPEMKNRAELYIQCIRTFK